MSAAILLEPLSRTQLSLAIRAMRTLAATPRCRCSDPLCCSSRPADGLQLSLASRSSAWQPLSAGCSSARLSDRLAAAVCCCRSTCCKKHCPQRAALRGQAYAAALWTDVQRARRQTLHRARAGHPPLQRRRGRHRPRSPAPPERDRAALHSLHLKAALLPTSTTLRVPLRRGDFSCACSVAASPVGGQHASMRIND